MEDVKSDADVKHDAAPVVKHEPTPEEVAAETKLRESLEWGHISLEAKNGIVHSNCKAVQFQSVEAMNKYFKDNPGLFSVQTDVSASDIVCIVDRVLSKEEQDILNDQGTALQEILERKRKERAEAAQAQKDFEDNRLKQMDDLMELGKKCQANHGAVIEDNKKYKKQIEDLKAEVASLKKDLKKVKK